MGEFSPRVVLFSLSLSLSPQSNWSMSETLTMLHFCQDHNSIHIIIGIMMLSSLALWYEVYQHNMDICTRFNDHFFWCLLRYFTRDQSCQSVPWVRAADCFLEYMIVKQLNLWFSDAPCGSVHIIRKSLKQSEWRIKTVSMFPALFMVLTVT